MSNLDDIVKAAQGGQLVDNLSERHGLACWQTEAAVRALSPALSAALAHACRSLDALRPVVAAIGEPRHKTSFESAESAHSDEGVEAGDAIVVHLFGSAAAAGEVSQFAARGCGLRADVLQRLLPVLVSTVAGGLSSTLAERGLDEAITRAEPVVSPSAEPEPAEAVAARPAGGGVIAFLASLLGLRAAPVAEQPAQPASAPAADDADEVLVQIRRIVATDAPVADDQKADLDALLGRVFGSARV
jgi:hypothetical protein